jgi:CubicO group peptidase (beta-lactamase class C family)
MIIGLGVSIAILGISLYWQGGEVEKPTPVAYLYISPAWADSVIQDLTPGEQVAQLLILSPPQPISADSLSNQLNGFQPGGYLFNNYSFFQQQSCIKALQVNAEVPYLMGMEKMRQGLVFPDPIALASVVSDSQITFIGDGLAEQAQALGVQFVVTPSLNCGSYDTDLLGKYLRLYPPLAFRRVLSGMEVICPTDPASFDTTDSFFQVLGENGLTSLIYKPASFSNSSLPSDSVLFNLRRRFKGLILVDLADTTLIRGKWIERYMLAGADAFIVRGNPDLMYQKLMEFSQEHPGSLRPGLRRLLLAKDWSRPRGQQFANDSLRYIHFSRQFQQAALTLLKDEKSYIPISDLGNKQPFLLTVGEALPRFEAFARYYAPLQGKVIARNDTGALPPFSFLKYRYKSPVIVALNNERIDALKDSAFVKAIYKLSQLTEVIIVNFGLPNQVESFLGLPTILQAYESHPSVQDISAQALFGGIPIRGKLPISFADYFEKGSGLKRDKTRLAYDLPESVGVKSAALRMLDSVAIYAIRKRAMPGCQVLVAKNGTVIYYKAFGHHTYSKNQEVTVTDLYDIASLSKIAGTTLAAMKMYETNRLSLNASLGEYFEDTFIELENEEEEHTFLPDTLSPQQYADSLVRWQVDSLASWADTTLRQQKTDTAMRWMEMLGDSLVVVYYPVKLSLSVTSNIFQVRIRDLLTHHSGIQPIVPIFPYLNYGKRGLGKYDRYFAPQRSDSFPTEVAQNLFLGREFKDSIWKDVKHLRKYSKQVYQYSDINMVLLQWAIDSINRKGLDTYLEAAFYRDLGTQTIGYRPLEHFDRKRIVPTSLDRNWRGQLLRGYVHDEVAALQGGVSGNAGLFTNANDLAIISQMLLNGGSYGGQDFLKPKTIELFTQRSQGHRGLGFDKPPGNSLYIGSQYASRSTYGHTGFTGTCVWIDPENDLVFIFLSNRVYPSRDNWRLNTYRVRQRMHDIIYEAL